MFSTNPIYDTIHLRLYSEAVEGGFTKAVWEHVINVLERGYIKPKHYAGENYYQGYLGNLRVTLFENRLTIKGSIWLYWKGNQLEAMSLIEARQAIEQLSNILRLPIGKAEVTRFDITANIETNYKPATYFNYLGKANNYKRLEQDNGLYYRKGTNQVLLYDKIREIKRKRKQLIPKNYENHHLLRYEFIFKKEISDQFNVASITAGTLLEESFYEKAREKWAAAYFSIQKERELGNLLQAVTNVKSFLKYLGFAGVKAIGGVYKLHQFIKQGKIEEIWDRQVSNSLAKKLNEIAEDPYNTTTSPLIAELDFKISQAAQEGYKQAKKVLPEVKL
jgi:hypothetical protein